MGAAGSITSFEIGDEVLLADGIESENGLLAGEYATITGVPKIGITSYKLKRISDEKEIKGTFQPDRLVRALPEKLDLETCRHIAGERFDQLAFNHFKDEDGYVTREQMLDSVALQKGSILELAADSRSKGKHEGSGCHRVGIGLKYSSEALRADRDVVIKAVKQAGLALEFASEELRADKEVVIAAMQQNYRAIKFAANELKRDEDVIMSVLEEQFGVLRFADPEIFESRDFMEECIELHWQALQYAPKSLRSDRDFVMLAAKQDFKALEWASSEIRQTLGIEEGETSVKSGSSIGGDNAKNEGEGDATNENENTCMKGTEQI